MEVADVVQKDPIEEDRLAPAPWSYHRAPVSGGFWRDWIEDYNGNEVVANVGHIDGPRIVRAINAMATKDGILS